jgi:chromosome segregation ATPase
MNPITQARKDIKFLVSLTKGLSALDDELERVGGLEKLEREIQGRVDALKSEVAGLDAKISACSSDCASRLREADQAKADAYVYVEGEYETAKRERAAARDDIANLKASALAEIAEIKVRADAELSEARKRLQEIDGQIVEAQSRCDALNTEADAAIARRDAANAEVERLQKLFGGKAA